MNTEIANYKHREIIKSWLFGEIVEFFNTKKNCWESVGGSPIWLVDTEYRIKPKDQQ